MAPLLHGGERDASLELEIKDGLYEEETKKRIKQADEYMAEVKRLLAGPLPEFERLRVVSWHRSNNMLKLLPKDLKVEDVLEIRTWLVNTGTWPSCKYMFQPPTRVAQGQPAKISQSDVGRPI